MTLLAVGAAGLYCVANAAPMARLSYQPTFARPHVLLLSQPTFVRPHALLAQGKVSHSKWRVYAYRSRERYAAHRPCIDASIGPIPSPPGSAPGTTVCGAVSPIPTVVGATDDSGGPLKTVITFGVGKEVGAVRIKISGGGKRTLKTRLLSRKQARATKLLPFRFAVLVRRGRFCIREIQGLAQGKVVNDSGPIPCGARKARASWRSAVGAAGERAAQVRM